ncbi:MAG: hypothetical protein ACRD0U_06170 [Acidimicrobiales bacterium]
MTVSPASAVAVSVPGPPSAVSLPDTPSATLLDRGAARVNAVDVGVPRSHNERGILDPDVAGG